MGVEHGIYQFDYTMSIYCTFLTAYILEEYSLGQVPVYNFSCTPSVTRGGSATATLSAPGANSQNWSFSGGGGTASKTGDNDWSGEMAVGGRIKVTFDMGQSNDILEFCDISVTDRNWSTSSVNAAQVPNGTLSLTLPVPPQASHDDAGLGVLQLDFAWASSTTEIQDDGPNDGFLYFTSPLTWSTHSSRYIINPDLEDENSTFSERQCGPPSSFISWSNLLTQTRRHEYNHNTQSHHGKYVNSMNRASNNPDIYFESRTDPPGTDAQDFANDTEDEITSLLNSILSDTAVEPYGVNESATGQFLGDINYVPYQSCP